MSLGGIESGTLAASRIQTVTAGKTIAATMLARETIRVGSTTMIQAAKVFGNQTLNLLSSCSDVPSFIYFQQH